MTTAAPGPGSARAEASARTTDWRDLVRDAADLALVGIAATVAALPVVTIGAAVATASAAVHERYAHGSFPSAGTTLRRFARAIVPGLGAAAVTLVVVALLALDLRLLRTAAVPGGTPLLWLTYAVGLVLVGLAALTVVEVGRRGGTGWRVAARAAFRGGLARPAALLGLAGTVLLAVMLAVMVPITAPLAAGYLLAALYGIAARISPS